MKYFYQINKQPEKKVKGQELEIEMKHSPKSKNTEILTIVEKPRIDFFKGDQSETSDHIKLRYKDLSKLIDLEYSNFFIFDSPPMNDYDNFMIMSGKGHVQQVRI